MNIQTNSHVDLRKMQELILPSWDKGPENANPCKNRMQVIGKRLQYFFTKGELVTNESIKGKINVVVLYLAQPDVKPNDSASIAAKVNCIKDIIATFKAREAPFNPRAFQNEDKDYRELRITERNLHQALDTLGKRYETGNSFEKNELQAVAYYAVAAKHGVASAQANYARCLQHGIGIQQDENLAIKWYKKAAYQGNEDARLAILQKVATDGNKHGQRRLAMRYETGDNYMSKDPIKAFEWYQKAAASGDAFAQRKMGYSFSEGTIVAKDEKTAFEWFEKSAMQNDVESLKMLSFCYEKGIGVEQNPTLALHLYKKANGSLTDAIYNIWKEEKKDNNDLLKIYNFVPRIPIPPSISSGRSSPPHPLSIRW